MRNFIYAAMAAIAMSLCSDMNAQEKFGNIVEFDRTIHNFGDVMLSDGPLSCTFTVKNISAKPVAIYSVATSCGCTDVKWSREPILPGKSGTISVTYTNDEGPYPFDKNLTVYISGVSRPIILKLRGVAHEKKMSAEELYTVRFGPLGLKDTMFKCGNLEVGATRSEEANVANLSAKPVRIEFRNVSQGLSVRVEPNPIPAGATAVLQYSVTGIRGIWGKNHYYAVPVVDGRTYGNGRLDIYAFTKDNFDSLSAQERNDAPRPMFTSSSYSFGKIARGTPVKAEFSFTNTGKEDFRTYKVDIDAEGAGHTEVPVLKKGEKGSFSVSLDTSSLPAGETLVIVTLTTNSPSRPIINLFITGWLE